MKFKGIHCLYMVTGCIILLASACTNANVPPTPTEFTPSPELVEFVADQVIVDARRGIYVAGTVVAYVTLGDPESFGGPESIIQAWRYEKGLVDISTLVFGGVRRSGSSRAIAFAFESPSSDGQIEVYVHTWYSRIEGESTRGGNAQKWTLEKQGEKWVIIDKDTYMYWD